MTTCVAVGAVTRPTRKYSLISVIDVSVFPVGLDVAEPGRNGRTYLAYGAHASPTKFLIDKKGILRCSPTNENLQGWIERLLGE